MTTAATLLVHYIIKHVIVQYHHRKYILCDIFFLFHMIHQMKHVVYQWNTSPVGAEMKLTGYWSDIRPIEEARLRLLAWLALMTCAQHQLKTVHTTVSTCIHTHTHTPSFDLNDDRSFLYPMVLYTIFLLERGKGKLHATCHPGCFFNSLRLVSQLLLLLLFLSLWNL